MAKELIKRDEFPTPARVPRGKSTRLKQEKKAIGLEAAAIAYVQMENGEYKYADGARRQWDEEGHPTINTRELMRRAGYAPGSLDHFDEYVGSQDRFWELVELHRMRRTDPMFRKEQEGQLWLEIGGESLKTLYETVHYAPHSMSVEQHLKVIKLILDAGITFQKMGGEGGGKAASLLGDLSEEKRKKVMEGFRGSLVKELEELDKLEMAHNAADRE